MKLLPRNPWLALPVAWAVFFSVGLLARAVAHALPTAWALVPQIAAQLAILGFAFGASAAQQVRPSGMGFKRPVVRVWGRAIGGGVAIGVLSTLAMVLTGATGMSAIVGRHSFAELVVSVWIVSSFCEEVFCRGWFQSLTGGATPPPRLATILPSAILFGGMHLMLVAAGVGARTVVAVVASTTLLGLLAAWARARSASIWPSIAAHVASNVGGVLAGIVYAVVYASITGKLPPGVQP